MKKKHYIKNSEFLKLIKKYQDAVLQAKELQQTIPIMSDELGVYFILLSNKLILHRWFRNYIFKDEMIADGIEDCCKAILKFNVDKSTNAFAYFTRVIYCAFKRRIIKEKKFLNIKIKLIERNNIYHDTIPTQNDDNTEYNINVKQNNSTLKNYGN